MAINVINKICNWDFDNRYQGMTLLEIVIYLAVFSLVFLSMIGFLFSFEDGIHNAQSRFQATTSEQFLTDHLTNSIRKADSVNLTTTVFENNNGVLQLHFNDSAGDYETKYTLVNGTIYYTKVGGDPVAITPNSMNITKLFFIRINDENSKLVGTSIDIEYTYKGLNKLYSTQLNLLLGQK